ELRRLVAGLVHHVSGFQTKQPRHLDVGAGFADALLPYRLLGYALAEGDARLQALHHFFERRFGNPDCAHAMVDAARAEAPLRDLETTSLAEEEVVGRHAHIVEDDFGMAVRRIIETEDRQHAHDVHALGIERHQNLRLLTM